ncbi:hypothetical protein E8E11_010813 [Didymella keratinophila]|nr:hypothetical protein E8E11_010813 [Didymella keratinophila]
MDKTIFITGGSGYVGRTLIALALSRGYTVHALSRSPRSDTILLSLGATPIRGDLTSLPTLTTSASQADIVISIADSLSSDYSLPRSERFRINNAANNALAEGLAGTGKALVTTGGSLHAAALPNHEMTDESSPGWAEGHWAAFNLDNATAQTDVTQAQLAQAVCRAIDVPCKELSFDEAVPKVGPFLAGFLSIENRASNRKAKEGLGWEVRGDGIMEEIENGSYVEVAKALNAGRGS